MESIQVVIMGETEARLLVQRIRDNLNTLADDLWELKNREGWKALGYKTWRDCAMTEFDLSQSRVYQLLAHAEVVKNIAADSTWVEKPTSERQTRPLTDLPPIQQPQAWKVAQEQTKTLQPTPKQVTQVVKEFKSLSKAEQTKLPPKIRTSSGGFSQVSRFDDFNQDIDFEPTGGKSAKERAAIGLLERLGYSVIPPEAAEGETCPYCSKAFK